MEDYIINTTEHEDIDFNELDKVIKFACKHLKVNNPMLNIVIVDKKRIKCMNTKQKGRDNKIIENIEIKMLLLMLFHLLLKK